jgi:8-oxo-dGTP pyrophosphatase MutT (NUDIX family)
MTNGALAPVKSNVKAGGLVFREVRRGGSRAVEILLVTSRSEPARWILPKGSAEVGESAYETAHREIREEAGVEGDLTATLGVVRRPGQTITYFMFRLAAVFRYWDDAEHRDRRWVRLDDAENHLSQSDLHAIVRQARRRLARA